MGETIIAVLSLCFLASGIWRSYYHLIFLSLNAVCHIVFWELLLYRQCVTKCVINAIKYTTPLLQRPGIQVYIIYTLFSTPRISETNSLLEPYHILYE